MVSRIQHVSHQSIGYRASLNAYIVLLDCLQDFWKKLQRNSVTHSLGLENCSIENFVIGGVVRLSFEKEMRFLKAILLEEVVYEALYFRGEVSIIY